MEESKHQAFKVTPPAAVQVQNLLEFVIMLDLVMSD
jgi:hypothetical protein